MALPIIVGVAGHRDVPPDCAPALEARVRALLCQIRDAYPDSPVELLSSLADGADRICAYAALSLGMRLIAPLPMAVEDYRADFNEASQLEFDALLARASDVFAVPEYEPVRAARGYRYRQAEMYIARHAHLLIALWDGRETACAEGGGTYEAVQLARENGCPVVQIQTPREGDPLTGEQPHYQKENRLQMIDDYNRDAMRCGEALSRQLASGRQQLATDAVLTRLDARSEGLMDACLTADALSICYRNRKLIALRVLTGMGLALVLLFLLYDEMESDLMLPLYAMAALLMVGVYLWSSRARLHEKYTGYRALAEALRVQFYWRISGIGDDAYDCCPFTQKDDLAFVGAALRALVPESSGMPGAALPCAGECVRLRWVQGQRRYHADSQKRKSRKRSIDARATRAMLILSMLLFALVCVLERWGKELLGLELPLNALRSALWIHENQAVTARGLLKIVMGAVSAATAFLANYYGSLALPQQIFDNQRMAALFEWADETLEHKTGASEATLKTLGRESILENAGWYVAQRENAPKLFF